MSHYTTFEGTQQLLDVYANQLAEVLECKPSDIKFEISTDGRNYNPLTIFPSQPGAEWSMGNYVVSISKSTISTFKMYQMPHCCAYAISCNVYVEQRFRNKGIGKILNRFRIDAAKLMGFSALLCTDVDHNGFQRKVLEANNWIDVHTIINSRTDNVVHLSAINLR